MERLQKKVNRSAHNGKMRTLKTHIVFSDGTHWKKGRKVRVLGVNYLYARVQLAGDGKFETAKVAHHTINWK